MNGTLGFVFSFITYQDCYFVLENKHSYYEETGVDMIFALGRK